MAIVRIDDTNDQRLGDYRNIPDRDLLARRGIFVAEGRLVVRRLLESPWPTRSVMVTDTAVASIRDLLDRRPTLSVYCVPQSVMNSVVGFDIHRGCLAIGERGSARAWQEVAADARRMVALEAVGNADNVGAVFRASAAFGGDAVLLGPSSVDPLYRKALRTSMGAVLTVPFARAEPWPAALHDLRKGGVALVGLTPSPASRPIREVVADIGSTPVVLVFGHEGDGVTADALAACTHHARIPITEAVDSLNVATAAAIALYELTRTDAVVRRS